MQLDEALGVLGILGLASSAKIDARGVRRAYLRRALEVHPDKSMRQTSTTSTTTFVRLREAYEVALRHADDADDAANCADESDGGSRDENDDIGDLVARAFRGEDVREALARRGGWRPGDDFGVDLDVRWMGGRDENDDDENDDDAWRDELEAGLAVDGEDEAEDGEDGEDGEDEGC